MFTRIVQIVDGVVYCIFNADGVDNFPAKPGEIPNWPKDQNGNELHLVGVSSVTVVEVGYTYDKYSNTFSKPVISPPEEIEEVGGFTG